MQGDIALLSAYYWRPAHGWPEVDLSLRHDREWLRTEILRFIRRATDYRTIYGPDPTVVRALARHHAALEALNALEGTQCAPR